MQSSTQSHRRERVFKCGRADHVVCYEERARSEGRA